MPQEGLSDSDRSKHAQGIGGWSDTNQSSWGKRMIRLLLALLLTGTTRPFSFPGFGGPLKYRKLPETVPGHPVDLRPIADEFERKLVVYKPRFKELEDFPRRKVNEPRNIEWELSETYLYPAKYRAAKPVKRKARIILRIEFYDPNQPGERWVPPVLYNKDYLFEAVFTSNEELKGIINEILSELFAATFSG